MTIRTADPTKRAFSKMQAKDMVRLQNPITGELLHLSGTGTTNDINYSWLGFQHQAQTLKARAKTSGQDWPFRMIHRSRLDPQPIPPNET